MKFDDVEKAICVNERMILSRYNLILRGSATKTRTGAHAWLIAYDTKKGRFITDKEIKKVVYDTVIDSREYYKIFDVRKGIKDLMMYTYIDLFGDSKI